LQITDYELRPDVIAVTNGPGLITSLMVGVETARTLAAAWNIPLVAVNHLEGHILAAFLKNPQSAIRNSTIFPALALLVSGGHTELVLMRKWLDYQVIGETLDDAAGEAFDKVAKILELPYPGGPAIEAAAKRGNASQQPFTPPMLNSGDFNFSFSGIKTAVLYRVRSLSPNAIYPLSEVEGGVKSSTKESLRQAQAICFRYSATGSRELGIKNKELRERNDIAAGFQKAVVEVLVAKTLRAAKQYRARTVILCGGVAANTQLRNSLASAVNSLHSDLRLLTPDLSYCGDNAAMIAAAGALRALAGKFTPWQRVVADPTLALRSSS
jgi:N6-L-threonylcarbamoyladenine synthase